VPDLDAAQVVGILVHDPQHPDLPADGFGHGPKDEGSGLFQGGRPGERLNHGVLREQMVLDVGVVNQILAGGKGGLGTERHGSLVA